MREGNLDPIDNFKASLLGRSYLDKPETVCVEWRGILTHRGRFGLLGAYFKVQEVLVVRLVDNTDCR
jgi:hypothetical protein